MTAVTNKNGAAIPFEVAVQLMDDDIREAIHAELAPCTAQEFFSAYEDAHLAAFGEDWTLSAENPTY